MPTLPSGMVIFLQRKTVNEVLQPPGKQLFCLFFSPIFICYMVVFLSNHKFLGARDSYSSGVYVEFNDST